MKSISKTDTFGLSLETITTSHGNQIDCEYPIIEVVNVQKGNTDSLPQIKMSNSLFNIKMEMLTKHI